MPTAWKRTTVAHLILCAFLATVGCNLVLGVDEVSVDGCPSPGALQCAGNALQKCLPNGQWITERQCILSCTDERCIDCEIGAVICNTATNSVMVCDDKRQWIVTPCQNQTCVNAECVGVCAPSKRCVANNGVESCVDGQWQVSATCPASAPCKDGVCAECNDGDRQCNGAFIETCLSSTWYTVDNCNEVGDLGSACVEGKCVGECAPGRKRCTGTISETCNDSGDWQGVDCASQYRTCDPDTGECIGECSTVAPATCVGNVVKSCDMTAHSVYDDCGPSATCVNGACTMTCGPASARCEGNVAQACNSIGKWYDIATCANNCVDGSCTRSTCDCGPNQGNACCASPHVPSGTYDRGNAPTATATLSAFRLDKYEVTVGRFRKFVAQYNPAFFKQGMGANPHVPGSGWKAEWNTELPSDANILASNLACDTTKTWTNAPDANENRPLNCLTWYEAFAFCIWDGGFLPTEAEWNYAAAGGSEQREFPWSVPATSQAVDTGHAAFNCLQAGSFDYSDCILHPVPNVGSFSPKGDGKFGHSDLAGSLFEWTLDVYSSTYPNGDECQDCANLDEVPNSKRVVRGGAWNSASSMLYTHVRAQSDPTARQWFIGARCARRL